jgi:uncharacterized membrane protein YeaQ/YmgE (transglycosylase-associated protein family)
MAIDAEATAGAITDITGGETANLTTTGTATLLAATGIGAIGAGDIDTTIGTLVATNTTSGNIVVQESSGLIIGGIARFLLPGPDPMSWPRTILFGIGGSFVGGMVGRLMHVPESLSFVLSVACAAGLIWFFTRRSKPKT